MPLPLNVNGVFPHLAVRADHLPHRSETGIGALMPWANRLWFVTYVAHKGGSGGGTGLFTVDDDMQITRRPESVVGTYANRLIHAESNQLIIGPHVIDMNANVRTIEPLVNTRLTATARHLSDPANLVYFLGMEGELFEVNVASLEVNKLADLDVELQSTNRKPHYKDACTAHGRLAVVNNSYYPDDFVDPSQCGGRLAEWNGHEWRILQRTQMNTLAHSASSIGRALFAVGQDRASAILMVYLPETDWKTYRLPKGTHTQDHAWTTEWPRIREVESERWLMDASGIFYELPAMQYGNAVWGVKPICNHLRIVGDFCNWNGMLVLAGDQTTPVGDANPVVGQPQANLWFGHTDQLWSFGKPSGWGGPWWETDVKPNDPSDPFLMTGFEHKCLHIMHKQGKRVEVIVEVDFMGTGEFCRYAQLEVPADGYAAHVFPTGFTAHWVRLTSPQGGVLTAQFAYM